MMKLLMVQLKKITMDLLEMNHRIVKDYVSISTTLLVDDDLYCYVKKKIFLLTNYVAKMRKMKVKNNDWNDLYSFAVLAVVVVVVGMNDEKNDENDYYYYDDLNDYVNVNVTVTVNGCVNANDLGSHHRYYYYYYCYLYYV